jgi:hypothetical protein
MKNKTYKQIAQETDITDAKVTIRVNGRIEAENLKLAEYLQNDAWESSATGN